MVARRKENLKALIRKIWSKVLPAGSGISSIKTFVTFGLYNTAVLDGPFCAFPFFLKFSATIENVNVSTLLCLHTLLHVTRSDIALSPVQTVEPLLSRKFHRSY